MKFSSNIESLMLSKKTKHLKSYLMQLARYKKNPSNDWSSLLVQTLLFDHLSLSFDY